MIVVGGPGRSTDVDLHLARLPAALDLPPEGDRVTAACIHPAKVGVDDPAPRDGKAVSELSAN